MSELTLAERLRDGQRDSWDSELMDEAADALERLERELAQAQQQIERLREWQPIETAPKDGREVILAVEVRAGVPHGVLVGHYMPGGYCIEDHPPIDRGWYFWNGCMFDKAAKPTLWIELPAHPHRRAALSEPKP